MRFDARFVVFSEDLVDKNLAFRLFPSLSECDSRLFQVRLYCALHNDNAISSCLVHQFRYPEHYNSF